MGAIAFPKPTPRCKHRWDRPRPNPERNWIKECRKCGQPRKVKAPKRPNPISTKRRKELSKYAETRQKVLRRYPGCGLGILDPQLCKRLTEGRGEPMEIDHVNGRRGKRLNDDQWCVPLHRSCHQHVTNHSEHWHGRLRSAIVNGEIP